MRNVLSRSKQFGTSAEMSERHFGTGAELSGHFGTSLIVPKCLGSEVSWVRSVLTPYAPNGLPIYASESVIIITRCDESIGIEGSTARRRSDA